MTRWRRGSAPQHPERRFAKSKGNGRGCGGTSSAASLNSRGDDGTVLRCSRMWILLPQSSGRLLPGLAPQHARHACLVALHPGMPVHRICGLEPLLSWWSRGSIELAVLQARCPSHGSPRRRPRPERVVQAWKCMCQPNARQAHMPPHSCRPASRWRTLSAGCILPSWRTRPAAPQRKTGRAPCGFPWWKGSRPAR